MPWLEHLPKFNKRRGWGWGGDGVRNRNVLGGNFLKINKRKGGTSIRDLRVRFQWHFLKHEMLL